MIISWYHGSIGRVEAERLLENQPVGSYLVRVSESNSKDYSLSLKNQSGYLHIKIVHQPADGFILGQFSQPFDSISSMIGFYKSNKLPIRGNENLKLLRPMIVEVL
ncbi:hypothetical protein HELRODRAFT_91499 [Helobdella robusta]|uniref:SH2 domain-containing protein n=1 Tax=Helobdella robusta TaxID=6412 RepID=T1G845_HELRO|nr:hypothetical protein HELRODRAFT_91499 [Helobdella robusta]ESO11308.1 hypothetical protein HELRODRAFT_91499 [Helobdella robusta]